MSDGTQQAWHKKSSFKRRRYWCWGSMERERGDTGTWRLLRRSEINPGGETIRRSWNRQYPKKPSAEPERAADFCLSSQASVLNVPLWRHIVKIHEVNPVTVSVLCDLKQVDQSEET